MKGQETAKFPIGTLVKHIQSERDGRIVGHTWSPKGILKYEVRFKDSLTELYLFGAVELQKIEPLVVKTETVEPKK